ncbi:MAG: hypothetical protein FD167_2038 [bacterium]|nr:MAG: hypothetical protein FD167_2038 [bacterium]
MIILGNYKIALKKEVALKKYINFQKMFSRQLYLIGFIFLLGLTIAPSQNYTQAYFLQDTNRVFTYPNNQTQDNNLTTSNKSKPHIVKESLLEINFRPLESEEVSKIELELLDQEVYKVTKTSLEKRSPTNYTWRGKIYNADGDGFDVILTIIDDLMTGLIYTPNKSVYQIIPISKGTHKIVLIDQNKFPECTGPIILPEPTTSASSSATLDKAIPMTKVSKELTDFSQNTDNALKSLETENTIEEDANTRIDVLILYSKEAIAEAGGLAQAKLHAQGSIDSTNTAYANSKISTKLNLVQVDMFDVSETLEYSSIVNSIRTNATIATMRNSVKADLVSLVLSSSSSSALCGIGFLTASSSFGFTVVNFGCAIGNLTFAHELGHNMGCQHNPENGASASSGAFPFSFGHFEVNNFRTIMSTASPNNPCGNCNRVPFFSNPDVKIGKAPTGVANQRDNAHTINERSSIVANFQQADIGKSVSLSVTPSTRFLLQGESASYTLNINRTDFPGEITVSTFCVNSNDCPFTSNLIDIKTTSNTVNFVIGTSKSLPVGNYLFAVKATASDLAIQKNSNNFLMVVKGIPSINNATYSKPILRINGANFESDDKILLNDKVVTVFRIAQSSISFSLKGSKKKLGLLNGTNSIVVTNSTGTSSNTFTFNFFAD